MGHDLRKYARQTKVRLVIGFLLICVIVGDGLIYLFYGRYAAVMGLICMAAGLAPVLLISVALWALDAIVRANRSE